MWLSEYLVAWEMGPSHDRMVASFDQPLDDMRTGLRQQSQAGSVFSLFVQRGFEL